MIAIGCDHGAFELKQKIMAHLEERGLAYKDFGCYSTDSVDYPDIGKAVCRSILSGECERGILMCSTGVGMSITANRFPGIRASLCGDCFTARLTREHNDSNVLVMGALVTGEGLAEEITDIWLDTPFSEIERHKRRIEEIDCN